MIGGQCGNCGLDRQPGYGCLCEEELPTWAEWVGFSCGVACLLALFAFAWTVTP